MTVISCRH